MKVCLNSRRKRGQNSVANLFSAALIFDCSVQSQKMTSKYSRKTQRKNSSKSFPWDIRCAAIMKVCLNSRKKWRQKRANLFCDMENMTSKIINICVFKVPKKNEFKTGQNFFCETNFGKSTRKRLSTKFRFPTENSLLLQTRTHRHTENKWRQLKSFLSACMTSFAVKKQFGAGVTELLFCNERGFVASFFKLIEETDSQRQIRFCAGAWLGFKRLWRLKQRKGYCGCINDFPFYSAKS